MKILIYSLKLATVFILLLCITLVPMRQVVPVAHAGGALATEFTAIGNKIESSISAVKNTMTAAFSGTTAVNTTGLMVKENLLDGIGWAIAKQMVSSMTQSLINWINSGFQGSPAFISDLDRFLLDALDSVAGEYIKSLGGIGEFICSPFKLDVQAALSINYAQARSGMPSGPTAPACKLSDIGNNIENFMDGKMSDWGEWLTITSNPQNTPYGAYLEAEAKLNIRLRNEAGQEIEIASWSDGFLSKRICESIEGKAAGKGKNCKITTPGKVISEALTFQLSTGPRSLIEADEINEIIGALINQLTLQAMKGINGLLGLGGNSNYTDYSYGNGTTTKSFIDAAADELLYIDPSAIKRQIDAALAAEISYSALALQTETEANRRLNLVGAGQLAIAALFNPPNSTASLIGINLSSTPDQAQTALTAKFAENADETNYCPTYSSGQPNCSASDLARQAADKARLDQAQVELNAVFSSLSVIAAASINIPPGTNLNGVGFSTLTAEGTETQTDLINLVAEVGAIKPTVDTNIITLNTLINRYDTASNTASSTAVATSTRTVGAIRQQVVLDYVTLVNSGQLSSVVTIETKRVEWRRRLP
jgi:hypothetical protein